MFEMLRHLPFTEIGDRLSFVLRFAPYSDVIRDAGVTSGSNTKPADGTYKISNIALEYDVVKNEALKNLMISKYNNLSLPYDRILRYRIIPLKKKDTQWNIQVNESSESLKGLLLLFVDPEMRKPYSVENEKFYNPKITKVDISLEGEVTSIIFAWLAIERHVSQMLLNYFGSDGSDVTLGELFYAPIFPLSLISDQVLDKILHGSGKTVEKCRRRY